MLDDRCVVLRLEFEITRRVFSGADSTTSPHEELDVKNIRFDKQGVQTKKPQYFLTVTPFTTVVGIG